MPITQRQAATAWSNIKDNGKLLMEEARALDVRASQLRLALVHEYGRQEVIQQLRTNRQARPMAVVEFQVQHLINKEGVTKDELEAAITVLDDAVNELENALNEL